MMNCVNEEQYMRKGSKRHVASNLKEIEKVMTEESIKQRNDTFIRKNDKKYSHSGDKILTNNNKARKPGPQRCVELFSVACILMLLAFSGGWDTYQLFTEEDLATSEARNLTWEYLKEIDPDLIVISPPCVQEGRAVNTTPNECRKEGQKKAERRTLPLFTEEIAHWQADRGR